MAVALEGTRSPIRKIDALLQLLKVYEVQSNALEQEKMLYELLEMDEVTANDFLHNLLKLHLGTVLSTHLGDPRGLEILEALPRESFPSGSIDWMEHTMALLRNYDAFARNNDCLYLANSVLLIVDTEFFEDFVAEIYAIKANALDLIGESECPQREAQYAYELLLKSEQFEAAKKNHQQFQH